MITINTKGENMKTCNLNDFMEELKPWLDKEHIRRAGIDDNGHMIIHFMDGMKNVYAIDDCNKEQVVKVLSELEKEGIPIEN